MRDQTVIRKARFEAALKVALMTAEQWAAQHDLHPGYLSNVLSGKLESARLTKKIDAFIVERSLDRIKVA